MTRVDKVKSLLNGLLTELGWLVVYAPMSGIYEKNHCYFVINSPGEFKKVRESVSPKLGVGVEIMVHDTSKPWLVMKDGFIMDYGSISKFLVNAYDFGMDGEDGKKTLEFVEKINEYAEMDDSVALGYKRYEEKSVVSSAGSSSFEISSRGIGNTMMFISNADSFPRVAEVFKRGVVYKIAEINGKTARIDAINGEDIGEIDFSSLVALDSKNAILAVEESFGDDHQVVWLYQPIITGRSMELDDSYSCFDLDTMQKTVVGSAMNAGVNYTVLLDKKRSAGETSKILDLLLGGIDCGCLVGKYPNEDQLDFLLSFRENEYAIDRFTRFNKSVDEIKNDYASFLEGIEFIIKGNLDKKEQRGVILKEAFLGHDLQKAIELSNVGASDLMIELYGRHNEFPVTATMLEQNGVENSIEIFVPAFSVSGEVSDELKGYFYAEGAVIRSKSVTVDWNQYLVRLLNSANSVSYRRRGLAIKLGDKIVYRDVNSLFITDSSGIVVWRCIYVNEKYYYYYSDLAAGIL